MALIARFRTACILFLSLAIFLAAFVVGTAAPRRGKLPFKVGDKVEFVRAGKIMQGEVLSIDQHGFVSIKYERDGKERTTKCRADDIQPIKKKSDGDSSTNKRRRKGEFLPGDEVEFEWMGEVRQGTVFSIDQTFGMLIIRFDYDGEERASRFRPDDVWPVKKKNKPSTKTESKKQSKKESKKESNKSDDSKKGEMRVWTDTTGKYKTKAVFVDLKDGVVRLKKEDGSIASLPLNKLSEADQWIAKRMAEDQDDGDPFATDTPADDVDNEDEGEEEEGDEFEEMELADGDWSNVRTLLIDASADGEITPDGAAEESFGRLRPFAVKGNGDAPEVPMKMLLDNSGKRLLLSFLSRRIDAELRLQFRNLQSGEASRSFTLNTCAAPADLSPDGNQIVCLPLDIKRHQNKTEGVEVWKLDGKGKLVNRWSTRESKKKGLTIGFAKFISPEQLLTYDDNSGLLTLWEVEDARAVYTLNAAPNCPPALSANRKQLAVMSATGPAILDAALGETLAALPGDLTSSCCFAFRPDGRQLAALFSDRLCIWDLTDKKLVREVWLSKSIPPLISASLRLFDSRLDWIGDNYILANGMYLIDIGKRIVLWQYQPMGMIQSCLVDGKLCYLSSGSMFSDFGRGGQSNVLFVDLPHPEAIKVAAGLSEEELFAVKPGSKVNLSVRIPGLKPDELDKIKNSLTSQLEEKGIIVAAGAPVTLEAVVERGKTETQTYHVMGRGRGTETVTVTQRIFRLLFTEKGRTLWERKNVTGGAPMIIHGKEGESLQETVNRQQSSPVYFFINTTLPQYLARYTEDGAFGKSILTSNGISSAKQSKSRSRNFHP